MHAIFSHFEQLTKIPHCSHDAAALKDFLIDFATRKGYRVQSDSAGNILATKGRPGLILQAHYDMVCVGRAPQIEIYEEEGWLMARDSTLGADNGIGVAMMMTLMDAEAACAFLFTADEEVGLIGANALAFDLPGRYMLNLDSEDEGEVYIGCAGGVDIFAQKRYRIEASDKPCYEIVVSGFPGGHSGVEIDKDIPNAIKYFARYCKDREIDIVSIEGGERINSIPTTVRAVVCSGETLPQNDHVRVTAVAQGQHAIMESDAVIGMLDRCPHGVLAYNEALAIPDRSLNLAQVSLKAGVCEVSVSARAMDAEGLAAVEDQVRAFFTSYGYKVKSEGKYPAWRPEINDFSKIVCGAVEEVFGACSYKAIHAGLECAVISDLYPDIKIASIGPNIRSPHSTHEKVEIASVIKTFEAVEKIVERIAHA